MWRLGGGGLLRLGKASILSDCLHGIYRYYEILGEEQYELHTRWLWRRLWKGIISLSSKSTAILTAIMSNSASHFGGRNGFTGGGKFFPWGGNCPPRYIVKKGTDKFKFCFLLFLGDSICSLECWYQILDKFQLLFHIPLFKYPNKWNMTSSWRTRFCFKLVFCKNRK